VTILLWEKFETVCVGLIIEKDEKLWLLVEGKRGA
jgi:hypothetical protein